MSKRNAIGWGGLALGAGVTAATGSAGVAVAGASAIAVLVAVLNFVIDPHERFRRPRRRPSWFSRSRHLNPGLARHREYDTVLTGSSLVEGIFPSDVDEALGGTCLKLPVPAISALELSMLLGVVIRAGRARRVVLPLDGFTFRGGLERLGYGRRAFPPHLYADGPVSVLPYLLSLDTLATSVKVIRRTRSRRDFRQYHPELYGYEAYRQSFSAAIVAEEFERGCPQRGYPAECMDPETVVANFRAHLLPRIESAPGITFLLYFPPYSVLAWRDNHRKGWLEGALAFRRVAFETLGDRPNVRLFDFQADAEIVTDLDQYRDVVHHSPSVDALILARLAAGAPVVTESSLNRAEEWLRAQAVTNEKWAGARGRS